MPSQIPFVDYLVLGEHPHLTAHQCSRCGARFFDHRDACASCSGRSFDSVALAPTGILQTYTIVTFAGKGVPVPYVAGVVDCDGTSVKTNIVNVEPTPDSVRLGMQVQLSTFSVGTDDDGLEAIGFGFEPISTTLAEQATSSANGVN